MPFCSNCFQNVHSLNHCNWNALMNVFEWKKSLRLVLCDHQLELNETFQNKRKFLHLKRYVQFFIAIGKLMGMNILISVWFVALIVFIFGRIENVKHGHLKSQNLILFGIYFEVNWSLDLIFDFLIPFFDAQIYAHDFWMTQTLIMNFHFAVSFVKCLATNCLVK